MSLQQRSYTPQYQLPGLRAEDLDLWGKGQTQAQGKDTSEEAQLLARLAVIQATKQKPAIPPPFANSMVRSTYNQVDLWGAPQQRPGTATSTLGTSNFIVPDKEDLNAPGSNRVISFLTKPLVIDKVEDATYETLIKMKEQVQQGRRDGHSVVETRRDTQQDIKTYHRGYHGADL